MAPTLESNLNELLSTVKILNLFSIEHDRLRPGMKKIENKERFTYGQSSIGKALELVAPEVQKVKERAVDGYLRDIQFTSLMGTTVPRTIPVIEKKDRRTTLGESTPGLSSGSPPVARIEEEIDQKFSLPKVPNFSGSFIQDGSDITLLKSLERLRELKSRDLDMHRSKEGEVKAEEEPLKTETGKKEPPRDLDKKRLYGIVEKILEEEAKRHGVVFR